MYEDSDDSCDECRYRNVCLGFEINDAFDSSAQEWIACVKCRWHETCTGDPILSDILPDISVGEME